MVRMKNDKKQVIENALLVELGNQTVQTILSSSTMSNEIVKKVIKTENPTNEDIAKAVEQLTTIHEIGLKSLEQKIKLLKEL